MDARKTTKLAFTLSEAERLSGLSVGQLRDWRDLVRPSWTSGLYGFRDLVALRTLKSLRDVHGISTIGLRKASSFLGQHSETPWSELKIGVGPKNRLYFFNKKAAGWESIDFRAQRIAEIALDHVAAALRAEIKNLRTRGSDQRGRFEQSRGVCGNQERFAGTRITVSLVRELIEAGATDRDILLEFPTLAREDIAAVRKLAAA